MNPCLQSANTPGPRTSNILDVEAGEIHAIPKALGLSISHVMSTSSAPRRVSSRSNLSQLLRDCRKRLVGTDDAMPESDPDAVVPAQLAFLAIYNPTLGSTDETIEDQIVFYTSRSDHLRHIEGAEADEDNARSAEDGRNERQRQIGLAQGMVNFAR